MCWILRGVDVMPITGQSAALAIPAERLHLDGVIRRSHFAQQPEYSHHHAGGAADVVDGSDLASPKPTSATAPVEQPKKRPKLRTYLEDDR